MDLGKVGTGVLTMIGGLCLMCEEASALVKLTSGSGTTPGMAIPNMDQRGRRGRLAKGAWRVSCGRGECLGRSPVSQRHAKAEFLVIDATRMKRASGSFICVQRSLIPPASVWQ